MTGRTLSLFEAYGIEIELMVVDRDTLDVRPLVDQALRAAAGGDEWVEDVDDGPIGWSNELVGHVLELKTAAPVATLAGVTDDFQKSQARLAALLRERWNATLLPGGMHPWMDPRRETVLWPHDNGPVYRAYDTLFDCRRHGWANLQSVHLNLPFAGEEELGRLLAAVRPVLPLIPALAASSPVVEGRATGLLDNRLEVYRRNAERVPSMAGDVIPEQAFTYADYRRAVFEPIDRELAALGADPVLLGNEWTNARGAIVRFDRMAVEIRLIDAQEGPRADLAVAEAVTGLVRGLVEERWAPTSRLRELETADLAGLLARTTCEGPEAELGLPGFTELFGVPSADAPTAGALLARAVERTWSGPAELEEPVARIRREGTLAQRILRALGRDFDRKRLLGTYRELSRCLLEGDPFAP